MKNKNTNFYGFKNKYSLHIQNNINKTFDQYSGAYASDLVKAMKYPFLSGGKFVRSLLVYATGSALNIDLKLLDQPALAIELIHTYSLIHDDLPSMDNDNIRRGAPSCHIAYSESTAILAGDALQTLAFKILSEKNFMEISEKQQLLWLSYLCDAIGINGIAGGQFHDLKINNKITTVDELEKIYALKTSSLITSCIILPYILDRSYPKNIKKLSHLGRILGLAFQVKDDLLGYTRSTKILGKTKNKDELRNQPNYVKLSGVKGTIKKLIEYKASVNEILEDMSLKNSMLEEISNYIFDREF